MPPDGGILYLTYCLPTKASVGCGMIAEVNPVTGDVLAQANYGPVGFGWYAVVATNAGVWLSAGGGGAGTAVALSWLWLIAVALAGVYLICSVSVEERYITEQFLDANPVYLRSTKMLVPLVF